MSSPPSRLAWRPAPPSPSSCHCRSTTAFGRATLVSVGAASVPFPRPAGEPTVALGPRRTSNGSSGWAMRREDEDDNRRISVVTGPVGQPVMRQIARISIGLRGRPKGPLASRAVTTPPGSPTPTLVVPGPPPALPSSEAEPSGSELPSALPQSEARPSKSGSLLAPLSPYGNRLLRRFAHLATPTGRGRAPGSWDSAAGPSR
jgi:hypothetical protein